MVTRRSRWSGRATLAAAVGIVVVVALDAVRAAPAARADARPNVVVVLVDDMGWSDIGPYGGEIPTPNLDALAGRGVRFTQFYSTPRCSPTRASLLTGLYPHQAGMGHLDNVIRPGSSGTTGRLNDRSVTIAEVLREAGYFTAMSGKWHLGQDNGSPPWQRGFDRVLSLRAGGMYFPNQNFRGGGDALTARAREPLYLDGTPTPRDAAVFGDELVRDVPVDRLRPEVHRRGAQGQQALLPLPAVQRAALPADGAGGDHRQASGQVQGRMGRAARGAVPPPDCHGPDRPPMAAQPARPGVTGLGIADRRREGPLRSSDGRLRRDDRSHRHEHRTAGEGAGSSRRPRQHAHPLHVGQRRQRRDRSRRALQR